MALVKTLVLPSALAATYHRIAGVFVKDRERVLEIHLEAFKDEATRRATVEVPNENPDVPPAIVPEWTPAATPVVRVSGSDFTALFGSGVPEYPTKPDLYAFLKSSDKSPLFGSVDA